MMGLQTNRIEVIGRMGIPIGNQMLRAAISVIGFPLTFMQAALSQYEGDKHKPQGELVRVGPRSLHAIVSGKSNPACPTVVLEAGMGGCALDWSLVQPKLSTYTKVLSYDRAGFGWSTGTLERPTCKHYVEDLRGLLSELKLTPPYLLVGHSYGGMIMRMFAAEYPDEVEESAAQLVRSRPLRADMPIAVLTAANQTEEWLEGQKVLLQLSKETQHTIVEDSWHAIQIHKPQSVIDAVVRLLNALV
ncbi:alpha/beta fold hydrolase [Paenibacillus sp. 2TAB19]|uniref:alpha/beta fold hydrolase n=1 Tax=Paenibacillus sp. 2TAB19 TaxID=3233003 RepID=UPI003F9B4BA5